MSVLTVHQESITRDEHGFFPSHAEYLRSRAVDPELARKAGLRSLVEAEARNSHKWACGVVGEVLCIAYGDGYDRYQLDRSKNESKTLVEPGLATPPFIPPGVTAENSEPLFIVEAPVKALALLSHGWQAIGLGGVNAGFFIRKEDRKDPEVEEAHPLILPLLTEGRTIYIAFDAGRANNPLVAHAEAKVAHFLIARGHKVMLVELPFATTKLVGGIPKHGEYDQGPDDFLRNEGPAKFKGLVAAAVTADPYQRAMAARQKSNLAVTNLLKDGPWIASVSLLDDGVKDLIRKLLGEKKVNASLAFFGRALTAKIQKSDPSVKTVESKSHVDLARAYMSDRAQHVGVVADGTIVVYDDAGVWRPVTASHEYEWILDNLHGRLVLGTGDREPYKVRLNKPDWEGCLAAVQILAASTWSKVVGASAPTGVSMRDGFLTLVEKDKDDPIMGGVRVELEPLSPRNGALYRHEVDWDPEAKAPEFDKFIDSLFAGAPDAEARKAAIQEFAGAALFGLGPRYQASLFLDGDGASGKSQLLTILEALMPPGSVSSVGVQDMGSEYRLASLATARLNCVAELSSSDWTNFEKFKALVTADRVDGRHPYGKPFSFRPACLHVFACNGIPRVMDRTDATERRMLIIRCERKFVPVPSRPHEAKAERGIASRIIQSDLQGIIAWAVEGALRLVRNEHYTVPASAQEAVNEVRFDSNSVEQFAESELVISPDPNKALKLNDLHGRFKAWAERTSHKCYSDNVFSKMLQTVIRRHLGLPSTFPVSKKVSDSYITHVEFKPVVVDDSDIVRPVAYDHMLGAGAN